MKKYLYMIRNFIYRFITKRTLLIIIVMLILLILENNVFAYNFNQDMIADVPTAVISYLENTSEYQSGNYDYFIFSYSSYFYINFFPKSSTIKGFFYNTNNFTFNEGFTYKQYQMSSNATNVIIRENQVATAGGQWGQFVNNQGAFHWQGSFNMYTSSTYTTVYYEATQQIIEPYITDNILNLGSLNMSNLTIDSGNVNLYNNEIIFNISTRPRGSAIGSTIFGTVLSPSSEFYNTGGVNGAYYEIPVSVFKDFLTSGYEITYYLEWRLLDNQAQRNNSEITVVYNPNAETVNDIELLNANLNSNFNKLNNTIINQFNNVSQQQQEANDTAKDTNKFLKDNSFDTNDLGLPSNNMTSITETGINTIFMRLYNAFTSGNPPSIIFPIPYTNKTFEIKANFLEEMLSTYAPSLLSIIHIFWRYQISVFIIIDISKKMVKLQVGEYENLEKGLIREGLL